MTPFNYSWLKGMGVQPFKIGLAKQLLVKRNCFGSPGGILRDVW